MCLFSCLSHSVKESHQIAEANQEKNCKMREALGISQYFVEGSSLDPERRNKEAAAAAAAATAAAAEEAKKKYTYVSILDACFKNPACLCYSNRLFLITFFFTES